MAEEKSVFQQYKELIRSPEVIEFDIRINKLSEAYNIADKISKIEWLQFGYPRMWETDVLEIAGILVKLGIKDKRMQESIDLIISKQDNDGKWKQDKIFNGRFLKTIEPNNKPSKWITLNAIKVIKGYYNLSY